jgi:hypothetical protein
MVLSNLMERFIAQAPIPVMAQALLERVLSDERLDACFENVAKKQYTRTLLFSTLFDLMALVVTNVFPSINAAYKARKADIGVSITAVYDKLNGLETGVSAALVKDTAVELREIITELNAVREPLLPGYRVKMLDGNCIEATEHRLEVLRHTAAGALPGKSLVVYDPALEMAIDVIPCEDGHAQERSLLGEVIKIVDSDDVFVMDRNFCVRQFLFDIADRDAYFVVRHHANFNYEVTGEEPSSSEVETGQVCEHDIVVIDNNGKKRKWRRITVHLNKKTRDGDDKITLLTNLPKSAATAEMIANLYRKRWNIETMFQELEAHLHSEINTLGYPKAALFGFCVSLMAYNVLAVVKAAIRSVHDEETVNEISGYYLAAELERTYEGMNVAIIPEEWEAFKTMTLSAFVETLLKMAGNVQLEKYKKNRRGPKKPRPPRKSSKKEPHVSTARLLVKKPP